MRVGWYGVQVVLAWGDLGRLLNSRASRALSGLCGSLGNCGVFGFAEKGIL